uniref:Uncharacterized protein n=1 Tax=Candidatus Kentrum sp. MB TaxID=2138164 RepID=A0A450XTU4_9GAMM|nr:MAG: hypothetical protein BECKMB1821G_GA0114241_11216 [Candidatus Kentron sp. MB]VFK35536.1 MAG: hypothetical protein BECKMB1821I_GA0114274_11256 [Candidatus Kentron sp. MB]VFK77338.1 MAG: hypothetical protein BECKMB1821H_GA0114242_11256 [Candidatus Kentron sp. MB]
MVRRLYVERMRDGFLSTFEHIKTRDEISKTFYSTGKMEPLCDFIEARLLKIFDNRDLRWSNKLVVKTLFLVALFNDTAYIMDSETAIDRSYNDLSLILRPGMRKYQILDHLLEFKHPCRAELCHKKSGAKNARMRDMTRAELRQLPGGKETGEGENSIDGLSKNPGTGLRRETAAMDPRGGLYRAGAVGVGVE